MKTWNETQLNIAVGLTAIASAIVGMTIAMVFVMGILGGFVYFVTEVTGWVSGPAPIAAPVAASTVPSKSWGEELWYAIPHDIRSWWTRPVAHGVAIRANADGCDIKIAIGADSNAIAHATSACERLIAASKPAVEPKVATVVTPELEPEPKPVAVEEPPLRFISRVPVEGTFGMEIYAIPGQNLLVLEYEGHQAKITIQHFFVGSVESVTYAAAFPNAIRVIYRDPAGNHGETWLPLDRTQWPWWVFKNSETPEGEGK